MSFQIESLFRVMHAPQLVLFIIQSTSVLQKSGHSQPTMVLYTTVSIRRENDDDDKNILYMIGTRRSDRGVLQVLRSGTSSSRRYRSLELHANHAPAVLFLSRYE